MTELTYLPVREKYKILHHTNFLLNGITLYKYMFFIANIPIAPGFLHFIAFHWLHDEPFCEVITVHMSVITQDGDSALMIAARWGRTEVVPLLLKVGANTDLQNEVKCHRNELLKRLLDSVYLLN